MYLKDTELPKAIYVLDNMTKTSRDPVSPDCCFSGAKEEVA